MTGGRLSALHVHRRAGATEGEPLVLCVHGAADRGAAFARVGRELPDVDLIRIDRRGYGRSPRRPAEARRDSGSEDLDGAAVLAGQVADLTDVVSDALAAHGAPVPLVICGHSHGALLALGAALADPRVSGVVAWEPPMPWAPWWSSGSSRAPGAAPTAGEAARRAAAAGGDHPTSDPAGDAMESFLRRMLGDGRWESLPPGVQAARRAEGPALLADLAAARAAGDLAIGEIAVPVVLGMGGATSERHRRAVEALAAQLPQVEVIDVPGADHGAHLTHPAAVASAVRRCLELATPVDGGGEAGTLPP